MRKLKIHRGTAVIDDQSDIKDDDKGYVHLA
jgi:hypothetical protein